MVAGRGQLIIDLVNKQYIRATNVKLCFWSLGPLGRNTDAAIFGKKKKNNTACKHGEYISEHIINIYAHI